MPQSEEPSRHLPPTKSGAPSDTPGEPASPDTAALRESEAEVRRQLSLLSATLEATADGILVVNREGRFEGHNRKFLELWDIPESIVRSGSDEEALAFVLDQLQEPEQFLQKVRELYAQPEAESFDVLEFKDGRVYERYSRPQWVDAVPAGRVWSFRDVTARRRAEEELSRYFTNSLDLLCIAETDGYFRRLNPEWERTLGHTLGDLEAHRFLDFVHPDDVPATVEAVTRLASQNAVLNFTNRYRHRNGSYRWIEWRAIPEGTKIYAVARDVTASREMELALREEASFKAAVVEQAAEGLCVYHETPESPNVRFTLWNDRMREITGYTMEEINRRGWFQAVYPDPDARACAMARMCRVREGHDMLGEEVVITHADGLPRTIQIFTSVIVSRAGTPQILVLMRDITERQRSERALQESEERYRQIIQNSPMGMHLYELQSDDRLVFMGANPAADRILGVDHAALIGKTIEEAFPPLIRTEVPDRYRAAARTGTTWNTEQIDYQDAQIQGAFEVWAFPTQSNRMVAMFADVAARKRTEKALLDSEEKFQRAFRNSPALMAITSIEEGRFVEVNECFLSTLGYSRDEVVGRTSGELEIFVDPAQRGAVLADLREKGSARHDEVLIRTKSGAVRHGSFSAESVELQGQPYLLTVMNDTTERQHLLAELTHKNKDLEMLLHAASHDLRSPLVNVQGFSRILDEACEEMKRVLAGASSIGEFRDKAQPFLDDRVPSALSFIRASVAKMDMLINGLLRLSRAGREVLHPQALDMDRLMESIVAASAYQIQQTGATVELTPLPACRGDSGQINQVFSNLLDNAIKHRDPVRPLRICISGRVEKDRIVYTVADTGKGVAPEHLAKIWELFWRLDAETPASGEGLGLTLARQIVERQHGTMWVESVPGEGSRFFVAMPAGQVGAVRPAPPIEESKR